MPTSRPSEHHDAILDQFTRQATPFATAPGIRDETALRLILEASGAGPDDTVLDVACGPGLVVAAFARVVRHATGIDITPAMLDRARAHGAQLGLTNVTWRQGDVLPLPWPDASFSIVTSRFAFHHFLDPLAVLREMRRVAAPGGRVVVVDSTPDTRCADAFNRLEGEMEALIGRSFPNPGDDEKIRQIFRAALTDDALDIQPRLEAGQIRYGFPVSVLVADR